ncbi:hypothetical protein A2331_02945 [Candidatus Falkowbacteria bacterium RIFOXYB2_FULL_34_18]|uniref:Methyltransferase domain-containing protein n=1 Tax=Candidatus Falkowbacteria bacterium RIFOXYD2_FULL_34_120 TaxID=1798007 RepID=A0A1F5TMP1_9BACT|nr:MAG: hypothetical protein A2331_02945 [Candidatus Falkowbacteria bacterium RIFOXYB2_FULL_34_18]OGF28331.1 MAG: hypothetical protein A2500_02995 [Candidatus Falkowbacteria bacterium RIFOXYC12_FULL_34_55]OGF37950.1 MAG: hypothetical protein A2466_06090 [Candidatus Falkowbacteria bacterium RIFOXYC2_FULL_34_220]OGF39668.1 MAG: hypothetical protein A2515_07385 [Candidatus Falkowbacteria bacterium RIFOXYD12_FULL_34_57]OGF40107.1 MAG: hypothetical protein A2531_05080 [Candidatus Falkowbacteria bact
MNSVNYWECEYQDSKLVTKSNKPQSFALRFFRFLKKEGVGFDNLKVLDLGCGTGRNANYLASLGAEVSGMDISPTAIKIAKNRAQKENLVVKYAVENIGEKYNWEDNSFDVIIDFTSSNALNDKEREIYLKEISRVLKLGGYLGLRTLRLEGDKNAKKLLKEFPGKEKNTYIMPETGFVERVFTKEDVYVLYGKNFKILKLDKKSSYTKFQGQSYKRNFWVVYMQKL